MRVVTRQISGFLVGLCLLMSGPVFAQEAESAVDATDSQQAGPMHNRDQIRAHEGGGGMHCGQGGAPGAGQNAGKGHNMPLFSDFDLDGDGVIAADEFGKARAERIAKMVEEGRQMKNLANAASFADLDADSDGYVSSDEFSAHQAAEMAKCASVSSAQSG